MTRKRDFAPAKPDGESKMLYRMTAFLAGLILVLSSPFAIAADATLEDVNRALASPQSAVLIGVPANFLHPEKIEDDGEIETQGDWAAYLNEWMEQAKQKNLKVVVVPIEVLAKALRTPVVKAEGCAVLFVKNRNEGLLNDGDDACVLQSDDYDIGAKWLEGHVSASEIAESGFKVTAIAARTHM